MPSGGRWTEAMGLVLLAGCGAPAPPNPPSPPAATAPASDSTEQATALLAVYQQAFRSRDLERIRSLFVADQRFGWFEDGELAYATPDAILEALGALPPGDGVVTRYEDARVVPLGADAASLRTRYETTMDLGAKGTFTFGGVITMVALRTDDGWRIVSGHTSTRRPATAGEW